MCVERSYYKLIYYIFCLKHFFFFLQNSGIVCPTGKFIPMLMVECQVRKKAQVTVSLTQLFKGMLPYLKNSYRCCLSSLDVHNLQIPLTFGAGDLGALSYWGGQVLQKFVPHRPGTKYSNHTARGFMSWFEFTSDTALLVYSSL